jgi:hypothetical protein
MSEQTIIRHPIPFYGSYASFYRAMKALKDKGIPRRVNVRALTPLLGEDEAPRIVAGFLSLSWIDELRHPTDDLRRLVQAFGEKSWGATIAEILPRTYSFITGNWAELTPDKLHDAFVAYVGRDVGSIRTAETFFLCLASESGIPIDDYFYRRTARAIVDATRSIQATEVESADEVNTDEPLPAEPRKLKDTEWAEKIWHLTALIDEQDMTAREKDAVLVLLSYLRRREQRERKGNAA